MPRHSNLAAAPVSYPNPPRQSAADLLAKSASATSVSFIVAGAAVVNLGELLRDLRQALPVAAPPPQHPQQERAAAALAARLQSVRRALDAATASIGALLEDCDPTTSQPDGDISNENPANRIRGNRIPHVRISWAPGDPRSEPCPSSRLAPSRPSTPLRRRKAGALITENPV